MMIEIFFLVRFFLSIIMIICAYIYSIKVYGGKITVITSGLITSFFVVLWISGAYSSVPLGTDIPFQETFGAFSDMISIFPSFLITFELGRYALGKTNDTSLTNKDIVLVGLIVSFFGICFQVALDISAAGLNLYYYTDPPPINLFGYPIYFLLSFTIYGLWGATFLVFERKFTQS